MAENSAAAYRGVRDRVTALVTALDPARDEQVVPATPEWSVHDLLAHLVGVTRDAAERRLDGVGTDAWTDAQVRRRRGTTRAALLAEWAEYAAPFERWLARVPDLAGGQAVFDAVTHEHDLRHALATPGARTSDAVTAGFDWLCAVRRAPALRFVSEAGERVAGPGDPVATVTASRFELLRAAAGRRTRAEVEACGLDDAAVLLAASFFTVRDTSLQEQDGPAPR